jgi:hypothetical protein
VRMTLRPRRPWRFGAAAAAAALLAACDLLPDPRQPPAPPTGASAPAPTASRPRRPRPAARPAAALTEQERFTQISRGLRRLVVAEEGFYAENGTYTRDLERVGFRPEGGTKVEFLWLSRDGWAASGTHPDLPGRDCVIYVGQQREAPATRRQALQGREGVPVCDRPTAPAIASRPARPRSDSAPAAAPGPDTSSALDAVKPSVQMKVDLRNLAYSQQTYFGTQGTFSRRIEPLALQYLWHRGVTVKILSAGRDSWAARATHAATPGKSCVIWFGSVSYPPRTEAEGLRPDRPGVPVCDD